MAVLKPLGYEIINLDSDQPVGFKDVIRLIECLVDREARVEFKPRHAAGVTFARFSARTSTFHMVMGESHSSLAGFSSSQATRCVRRVGSKRLHKKMCVSNRSRINVKLPTLFHLLLGK